MVNLYKTIDAKNKTKEKSITISHFQATSFQVSKYFNQGILTYYVEGSITSDSQRNLPYCKPPESYSHLVLYMLRTPQYLRANKI